MLKKSNTSAIIMAMVALLSALLTLAIWELLRSLSLLKDLVQPQSTSSSNFLLSLIAIVAILFIVFVLPGAFVIRNWDDMYFGKEGAIRWGIFGIAFGCLSQLRILIPKALFERGSLSFFVDQVLGLILSFIVFYTSHFFAFKFLKGKRQENHE